MDWTAPKFDYDALSFLLLSEDPAILRRLALVERRIYAEYEIDEALPGIHEIARQLRAHVKKIHPELKTTGFKPPVSNPEIVGVTQ